MYINILSKSPQKCEAVFNTSNAEIAWAAMPHFSYMNKYYIINIIIIMVLSKSHSMKSESVIKILK